jgi:putative transposase
VGLCLTHIAADKQPWLQEIGVEAVWPIIGRPRRIGVDNASEFHSEALARGCVQHDIEIDWRPVGRPQYGGIVERVIGTLMELVHGLPGTTFSSVMQRGRYDSDKAACLTLAELERWLTVAIAKLYHLRPHAGLYGDQPLKRYEQGVRALAAEGRAPPTLRNPRAFPIDFLRRSSARPTAWGIQAVSSQLEPMDARNSLLSVLASKPSQNPNSFVSSGVSGSSCSS